MNHPRNLRNVIFVCSLVVLALAICLYAYLYQETSVLIGKTISAREDLRSTEAAKLQGKDIVSLYETSAVNRAQLRSAFVPSENAVAVIQAIETVGESSGALVTISSINATAPTDKSKIGQVSAAVSINGDWKSVIRALTLFEDLPYASSMNNLALRHTQKWQADFGLVVSTIQTP